MPERHDSRRIDVAVGAIAALAFGVPLLLGGWTIPWVGEDPAFLSKGWSQFRNPLVALAALAAVGALASRSFRAGLARRIAAPNETAIRALLLVGSLALVKASFLDFASLSLNAIDASVYDWATWNTGQGRFMRTVTGVNHFGIHATPILFLLLPLHALFASPLFAVFAHPLALAGGGIALAAWMRGRGLPAAVRFWIVFAYFGNTLVAKTLHYGFHVEAFYPLAGFLLFIALDSGRALRIALALAFFLSVKEDAPFYAAGIFAAYAALRRIPPARAALGIAVCAAVAVFYLRYLIPANATEEGYRLVHAAAALGDTPGAALKAAIADPGRVLANFARGGWWPQIVPAAGLLGQSLGFWIASAPFFGIYSLAGGGLLLGLALYYGSPWIPALFLGWVEGFTRDRLRKRAAFFLGVAVLGTTLVGSGYLVFRRADLAEWARIRDFARGLTIAGPACVPGILFPQLPYSENARLLASGALAGCAAEATRIVTPTERDPYPLTRDELAAWENMLPEKGWRLAEVRHGFRVYSRRDSRDGL